MVGLGAFLDVRGFTQLSDFVVHHALSVDDLFELGEGEVVVANLRHDIFVLVVVLSFVELGNSARLLHARLVHDFFCTVVHFLVVHVVHVAARTRVARADGRLH